MGWLPFLTDCELANEIYSCRLQAPEFNQIEIAPTLLYQQTLHLCPNNQYHILMTMVICTINNHFYKL